MFQQLIGALHVLDVSLFDRDGKRFNPCWAAVSTSRMWLLSRWIKSSGAMGE